MSDANGSKTAVAEGGPRGAARRPDTRRGVRCRSRWRSSVSSSGGARWHVRPAARAAVDPGDRLQVRRRSRAGSSSRRCASPTWPRAAASTSPRSPCRCRPASCWSSPWRCSAATRWRARRAGRRCATCWPRRCPVTGCCGRRLIVALGYSAAAVICLPLMALLAGTLAFGWNDIRVPGTGETIAGARGAAAGSAS